MQLTEEPGGAITFGPEFGCIVKAISHNAPNGILSLTQEILHIIGHIHHFVFREIIGKSDQCIFKLGSLSIVGLVGNQHIITHPGSIEPQFKIAQSRHKCHRFFNLLFYLELFPEHRGRGTLIFRFRIGIAWSWKRLFPLPGSPDPLRHPIIWIQ